MFLFEEKKENGKKKKNTWPLRGGVRGLLNGGKFFKE